MRLNRSCARAVVVSPGPGTPDGAGVHLSNKVFAGKVPILGSVPDIRPLASIWRPSCRAPELMHGKASEICHDGKQSLRSEDHFKLVAILRSPSQIALLIAWKCPLYVRNVIMACGIGNEG